MQNKFIEKLLDQPSFYSLVQNLLAYGANDLVLRYIERLRAKLPNVNRILDIGCGPKSWLWQVGAHPVGLDLTYSYCKAFHETNEPAVMGSAAILPFPAETFEEVWSIGMFHHLPDLLVRQAFDEMLRVCRSNGHVLILDAVLPVRAWQRPLAYALRRADRGRFVRSQAAFEELLPQRSRWAVERVAYSHTGMEIVICQFMKH
ncbi:MAG TPA: class I SAM-dependent methyltransferase [Anaerolineales bacterium]|jgi:SAM-dependent methyltransferase|nr:class I SAM-dependent methyltransferase [Anaerolineales bacterium]